MSTDAKMNNTEQYKDEETLRRLYIQEEMTVAEVARELDTAKQTLKYWLDKYDLTRSISEAQKVRRSREEDPWKDEDVLRKEYVEHERSSYDLADEWGCDSKTVRNWLERFGIERREAKDYNRVEYVRHEHSPQGYERWQHAYGKDRGALVLVHRLLAVAEYGTDAVVGNHVHHKNGVPWDNRPENIELKDPSTHARDHYENGDLALEPGGIEELKNEL